MDLFWLFKLILLQISTNILSPFRKERKMKQENDPNRFKILAEKRINKALKDIKLIGNLSNKSNYAYSQADANKIYSALKKALDTMKSRFDAGGAGEEDKFVL